MQVGKMKPWAVGLLQACVIILYIVLFATIVQMLDALNLDEIIPERPIIIIPFMLTTFVFSALVCGGAALGYPFVLLFQKNAKRAVTIIVCTAAWLAIALVTYLTVGLMIVQSA